MQQPKAKAIVFFFGALAVGYALAIPIVTGVMKLTINPTSFANLTAFAILFAVLMTVWLDKPLELELIKWPEKKAGEKQPKVAPQVRPPEPPIVVSQPESKSPETTTPGPDIPSGSLFPHESPSEHWDVDFGDSNKVYQGADLPVWILAGWAVFIIWALIYLISGLPTAFD